MTDQPSPPPRRAWLLTFLGFFLLIGAWAVAAPYDGTPDEQQHVLRAAGVAAGQVLARPDPAGGAVQIVPGSLIRENCFRYLRKTPASCATEPGGDQTPVQVTTAAGRYHPIYYALVGWPLRLSPDWTGILLARLLSAALCAALLANALTDAIRWSRHRLMVAGVLAATTPMAAHMAGAVNPNGVEIAAGISFFAAAIPLLYHPDTNRTRTLLRHAGTAAIALTMLRAAGPLWLALSAAALTLPLGWRTIRPLWQQPAIRRWTLATATAATAATAWTMTFKTGAASVNNAGRTLLPAQAIRQEIDRWSRYADELVGITGWLDTRMPEPGYLIWQYAIAALVFWGFVVAARTGRWQLAALLVMGLGVPFAMQVVLVNSYGFITQGRYLLPVVVGLPILAAYLIQMAGLDGPRSRTLVRLYAMLLLPIHLICLWYTMVRWQHGLFGEGVRDLSPLGGPWHPPLGSLLPLGAATVGAVLVGALAWRDRDSPAAAGPPPDEVCVHHPPRQRTGPDDSLEASRVRAVAGKAGE